MKRHRLVERQHPIFSPIALASAAILIVGLSLYVTFTGGRAFNPGDLSAHNSSGQTLEGFTNHAEFQDNCNQCHAPFKGIDPTRCESCHASVGEQHRTGQGLHSRFDNVARCAACHQEHKGRAFDLTAAAIHDFDHSLTPFSLDKHERDYADAPLDCTTCHTSAVAASVDVSACLACHKEAKPDFMTVHEDAFGQDCVACHDGLDTLAAFTAADHAEFFALDGLHADVACESCHDGGRFEETPTDCFACHAEPERHRGLFGTDCAACHAPTGWSPATLDAALFNHADTGFSLARHVTNFDQQPFSCATCHTGAQFGFAESQCADCHAQVDIAFMTAHVAQFGVDCLQCHDGVDRMANFDHATIWPLEGRHATADCAGCHVDQVFAGTPHQCVACHPEPTLHAGLFGLDCAACHTPAAWRPARLTNHTFPLNHGEQGEIPCATCHTATFDQYTCYTCHERVEMAGKHQEEGIRAPELEQCVQCHPTGTEDEAESD
ncbi:MAG: cytochrome c3 family protein [Anaerolineales bacterium]|nr:cytochrome c3 family protein [Anaerolineales bacterium]MCB8951445.1 cytochrome c3 family protein [Ardenticatenales bacterium]